MTQAPAFVAGRTRRAVLGGLAASGGAVALAACGAAGEGGTGTAKDTRPVRLNVLMGTAGAEPILDKLKDSFKTAHPNVTVEYSEISGTAATQQKIACCSG